MDVDNLIQRVEGSYLPERQKLGLVSRLNDAKIEWLFEDTKGRAECSVAFAAGALWTIGDVEIEEMLS